MATISKLVVSLEANSAKLYKALNLSEKRLKGWGKSVASITKRAAKAFKVMSITAAGVVTGIAAITLNAASNIKQMANMADAFGISTKAMQEWGYAAKTAGVSTEKVGDIFKDISDKLGDFLTTGGGGAADLFKNMNIQAEEFIGLAPDEALLKLGEAMEGLTKQKKIFFLESIASDTSLLLPLLDQGGDAFRKLAKEAQEMGVILSGSQVAGVQKFNASMDRMKAIIGGVGNNLAAHLSPAMDHVITQFTDWVKKTGGVKKAASVMAKFFINAIGSIVVGFAKISKIIGKIQIEIMDLQVKWLELMNPIDADINTTKVAKKIAALNRESSNLAFSLIGENEFIRDAENFIKEVEVKMEASANSNNEQAITDLSAVEIAGDAAAKAAATLAKTLDDVSKSTVWQDIFKTEEITARSNQFDEVARRVKEGIESGSKFTVDHLKHLGDILESASKNQMVFSNNNQFEKVDVQGMAEVVKGLTLMAANSPLNTSGTKGADLIQELRNSGLIGEVKVSSQAMALSAEKMANSNNESNVKLNHFIDKLNSTPQFGNLELKFVTDTGEVAGKIFAEPKFVDDLRAFTDRQRQEGTRADSA